MNDLCVRWRLSSATSSLSTARIGQANAPGSSGRRTRGRRQQGALKLRNRRRGKDRFQWYRRALSKHRMNAPFRDHFIAGAGAAEAATDVITPPALGVENSARQRVRSSADRSTPISRIAQKAQCFCAASSSPRAHAAASPSQRGTCEPAAPSSGIPYLRFSVAPPAISTG